MGTTATVYVLGDVLAVDCDACHESLLTPPVVAVSSEWIALAVSDHQGKCKGTP